MLIDLSVPINAETPVYPGDPATKVVPAGVLEKDGFQDHYVSIGTHVGTHIDAPAHMLAGGQTLDQFTPDRFVGSGKLIDVKSGFDLATIQKIDLKLGDIVLFYTGRASDYHQANYFEDYPVMSKEIADYLISRKVSMIGVDACSVDNAEDFPIHKKLLADNVLIIENLTNLDQLIGKQFTVYALPIKLTLDGAPARVIARTED